jgi:glycosyltransferase involved in cell wall biosynthesis
VRILVVSWYVAPGVSGGWNTALDVLQPDHEITFLVATGPMVTRVCDGISVTGLGRLARMTGAWPFANRIRQAISEWALSRSIQKAFRKERAELVLCLDELSARGARSAGVPYAIRFHCHPGILGPEEYERVIAGALFATGTQDDIPGTTFIPHGVDLERFTYLEPERAESVVMPASLVTPERPDLFVRGAALSSLRGIIVGHGPMRREIGKLCAETGGKVSLLPPVNRSELPALLASHQIGVACLQEDWHTTYQIKVSEYQAAGLFPLVQPWSELARVRPDLTRTFRDERELAAEIDWVAGNWESTLETRRRNRQFVESNYDVREARKILAGLLEKAL